MAGAERVSGRGLGLDRLTATLCVAGTLLLGACGVPRPLAGGDPEATFPHPDGYEQSHATESEGGSAGCGDCHGLRDGDGVAGGVPAAPSCRSCHAAYPHPASFADGGVHAGAWGDDPAGCAACHGEAGERAAGGVERGRCTGCHSTYPHPEGWAVPTAHGAAVRGRGPAACSGCHDNDDPSIGACAGCHAPTHPLGYRAPDAHGLDARAAPQTCAPCHEQEASEPGRRACASCHDIFPHSPDWSTRHLAVVDARGRFACAGCHPEGVAGPSLPATCGRGCHDGGSP